MERLQESNVGSARLVAAVGDLTRAEVDAVVNAANSELRHGGGVAAALSRAAGPRLQQESDAWVAAHGPLTDGQAAVTTAGDLPARVVVHVAGPVYDESSGENEPRLRAAVRAAIEAAVEAECRRVAYPAISAGIYGYPPQEAARILTDEVAAWCRSRPDAPVEEILLVGYDRTMGDRFVAALGQLEADPDAGSGAG